MHDEGKSASACVPSVRPVVYGGSASHAHVRWHALALSSTFPGPHWLAGGMGPPLYSAAGGGVASEKLGQTHGGRDGRHIITNDAKMRHESV